jgi:hypothetical protein
MTISHRSFARTLAAGSLVVAATTALTATSSANQVDAARPSGQAVRSAHASDPQSHRWKWRLSRDKLPVERDHVLGLKLQHRKVLWVGGDAPDPSDSNRAFLYDVDTRTSREVAPVPAAKRMDGDSAAGVLKDGTVVVVGGDIAHKGPSTSRLSYRYDPATNTWTRTGDLPEAQGWFIPSTTLRDGRILLVGGYNHGVYATGAESRKAFVYDVHRTSTVQAVDPATGQPTGRTQRVEGGWDYTRSTTTNRVTMAGRGHDFGNVALLNDGRVFVAGGHTHWNWTHDDISRLARYTDYFDPETGQWTTGAPLPSVPGEDDQIPHSHGGRTNGVCMAVMGNGKVVIAGGASAIDGQSYFHYVLPRQSVLVMTPAADPANSHYQLSPNPIPSGHRFGGGPGGGDGRIQLMCYRTSPHRLVIAGGQDAGAADLYDTYIFDSRDLSMTPGPLMVHAKPIWSVQHPEWGYPPNYETAVISTRAVAGRNSRLVFGRILVHGGAYDGAGDDTFPGSRYVEQFSRK